MGHCLGHNDRCTAMESYGGRQGAWEKKVREESAFGSGGRHAQGKPQVC